MSLWEFAACMDGLSEFHGGKKPSPGGELSDEWLAEHGIEGF
ncbi:hypothetical protein QKW60_05560 [Defluviimonas aestuarii]|nr:hypothetical protein [Defluviimonas aestuarii]